MSHKTIAVIIDIVRSRSAPNRADAQQAVEGAFAAAHDKYEIASPFVATVGDEFQAVYSSLVEALRVTLLARLLLPDPTDIRVGLGDGEIREIASHNSRGPIQDGSAWWCAREAIVEAHRREDRGDPWARSWFAAADGDAERILVVNSHLLLRDQIVSRMSERAQRLTAGVLSGQGQDELAEREGVSQSAVSQSLHRSGGAALLAAQQLSMNMFRS